MGLESPNNLRFSIIYGEDITILSTPPIILLKDDDILVPDPKGWDSESVARNRTDDFGVNSEVTLPLSFIGDSYELLRDIYLTKGQFSVVYLLIEKRKNDWDFEPFYRYRLDFSKATDNMYKIDLSGVEEGLAVSFEKYKDTEYEIDLPTNKNFINYTGASYVDKNVIQCEYGEMSRFSVYQNLAILKGSRSVRSYTDVIAFTDLDGLPYQTMTFRALKTQQVQINLLLKLTIEADASGFSSPDGGHIVIYKYNTLTGVTGIVTPISINPSVSYPFSPATSGYPYNNVVDNFDTTANVTIAIETGNTYSFIYVADSSKSYDHINIIEGSKCRIEFSILTASAYQNVKLECFTYEWLISELLKKIHPSATFESSIEYPHVKEVLSATPCITNIGKEDGTGKLKTTLKDVLESYHKLHCTMHDITLDKLFIKPLSKGYDKTINNGTLEVVNIEVIHDTKHQYNKVKVGADTDDREDDEPLIYPFVCEKEYSVENSLSDAELDLVNPFRMDCYAIDKYIKETFSNSDNKDECEFMIFACSTINGDMESKMQDIVLTSGTDATIKLNITSDTLPIEDVYSNGIYTIPSKYTASAFDVDVKYNFIVNGDVNISQMVTDTWVQITSTDVELKFSIPSRGDTFNLYGCWIYIYQNQSKFYIVTDEEYSQDNKVFDSEILLQDTFLKCGSPNYLASVKQLGLIGLSFSGVDVNGYTYSFSITNVNIDFTALSRYNLSAKESYDIYKGHNKPIGSFTGNSETVYNVPLTPKRILQRWAEYLAISVVGSSNKRLKFQTTTIKNSAISSRCDWETADVVENTDLDLSATDPLFLPAIITFDTYNDYDRIMSDNKYGYYSFTDKKQGRQFEGYVNKTSYAVGENQTQQWEQQAKKI